MFRVYKCIIPNKMLWISCWRPYSITVLLQEAIIKILKMRKRITNVQLQTELVDILKNMFLPSKKMIKEQIEWLIEHKYMKRDEDDINTFIYMAWNYLLALCLLESYQAKCLLAVNWLIRVNKIKALYQSCAMYAWTFSSFNRIHDD